MNRGNLSWNASEKKGQARQNEVKERDYARNMELEKMRLAHELEEKTGS